MGHPEGDVYAPRPSTNSVLVEGEYEAGQRRFTIYGKVGVFGEIGQIIKP
jgi:hypothetical protein